MHVKSRCAYQKLLSEKRQSFKRKKDQSLADSIDDPKQFWKEVRHVSDQAKSKMSATRLPKISGLNILRQCLSLEIMKGNRMLRGGNGVVGNILQTLKA